MFVQAGRPHSDISRTICFSIINELAGIYQSEAENKDFSKLIQINHVILNSGLRIRVFRYPVTYKSWSIFVKPLKHCRNSFCFIFIHDFVYYIKTVQMSFASDIAVVQGNFSIQAGIPRCQSRILIEKFQSIFFHK